MSLQSRDSCKRLLVQSLSSARLAMQSYHAVDAEVVAAPAPAQEAAAVGNVGLFGTWIQTSAHEGTGTWSEGSCPK